jgi:hypothetical protein
MFAPYSEEASDRVRQGRRLLATHTRIRAFGIPAHGSHLGYLTANLPPRLVLPRDRSGPVTRSRNHH